jgi:hypothetical protein
VRAILRFEGVQLHLGLRVVDISPDVLLGHPFLQKHNPVIDWSARSMCLRVRQRSYVVHAIAAPPSSVVLNPPEGVRAFRCTNPPYAQPPLRNVTPSSTVFRGLPAGESLPESEALEVGLLNFVSKADFVEWLCPVAELPTPPPEAQPLLREFADVFPLKLPPGLPVNRVTDHRIDLVPDSKPPAHRLYRMSPEEDKELKAQMDQYLADGYIEPARSAYGAGVLFARKKDGGLRLCIDYRALNKISQADKYPMPRIDELLDSLKGSKVFSKLDLQQGFHQIRVFPEHVERTAFQTKFGSYQFKVMPFGLCNAPATFQRTMDMIFDKCRAFVSIYLDDLIIHSKTLQEHLAHLRQVFSILRTERFYAKPSKCEFMSPKLDFVGFVISAKGISPQESKLKVVWEWPSPTSVNDVRIFLGMCGFYQRFVQNYSSLVAPLTDLLKKTVEWHWDPPGTSLSAAQRCVVQR